METTEVVFQHTMEGLFKYGVPSRVTPSMKQQLKEVGLDLDRPLEPAYPRATWNRVLSIIAREGFSTLPEDAAFFQVGHASVVGFTQTLLGKAVAATARLLGPKRTLERMTRNLHSASNYNQTKLVSRPDGTYEFWVNEPDLNPRYFAGILSATLQIAGGKEIGVELQGRDAEGCRYLVHWQ